MVRSKYCNLTGDTCATEWAPRGEDAYDEGGYFIINGNEKVMTGQLRLRHNRSFVFLARKNDKFTHVAEVRSCHASKWRSTSTMRMGVHDTADGSLSVVVHLPFVMRGNSSLSIPFGLLWAALREDASDRVGDALLKEVPPPQPAPVCGAARRILDHMLRRSGGRRLATGSAPTARRRPRRPTAGGGQPAQQRGQHPPVRVPAAHRAQHAARDGRRSASSCSGRSSGCCG